MHMISILLVRACRLQGAHGQNDEQIEHDQGVHPDGVRSGGRNDQTRHCSRDDGIKVSYLELKCHPCRSLLCRHVVQ